MSNKPVLVVTRNFSQAVVDRIERDFEPRWNPSGTALSREALLQVAEGADALLVSPGDVLDAAFFAAIPKSVKAIATFSVGYDHIDVLASMKAGVPVGNTPDVLTDATADVAMLLLLGASRRAYEAQSLLRAGLWRGYSPTDLLGTQPTGKVLGVYGMGRIGQATAARARAFGMEIHYHNRRELPPGEALGAVFHETAESLLKASQFLTLHAPSTAATRHALRAETLALLPKGAIVINTARGGLVDDDALIDALESGHVAAAGLDVYEGEPNLNPRYLPLKNVYLLPHIGSATLETRTAMGMLALDNIDATLAGREGPTRLRA
jgi:lactate dehydrogenase-like 2-hydroxyacid dehydrogenase